MHPPLARVGLQWPSARTRRSRGPQGGSHHGMRDASDGPSGRLSVSSVGLTKMPKRGGDYVLEPLPCKLVVFCLAPCFCVHFGRVRSPGIPCMLLLRFGCVADGLGLLQAGRAETPLQREGVVSLLFGSHPLLQGGLWAWGLSPSTVSTRWAVRAHRTADGFCRQCLLVV